VPLWWSVADARSLTGRDPRLDAAAWVDTNVPVGARIAADTSTLPLRGRPFDSRRDLAVLRADGVRWIVLGGSVADRVLAAASHYPREARFYRTLESMRPAYATRSEPGHRPRPWLHVYRLG
jgi:hypothetical protein